MLHNSEGKWRERRYESGPKVTLDAATGGEGGGGSSATANGPGLAVCTMGKSRVTARDSGTDTTFCTRVCVGVSMCLCMYVYVNVYVRKF